MADVNSKEIRSKNTCPGLIQNGNHQRQEYNRLLYSGERQMNWTPIGTFVGIVADDPDCKIELKSFHCQILNDHEVLKKEQQNYKSIPVIRKVDAGMIQKKFLSIKQDIEDLVESEMGMLTDNPELNSCLIKKNS